MDIRFADCSVRFGDKTALFPVSLTLTERRIGIIGLNGSGKTTFARLINGLADVAQSDYAGAVVWGWSNGYELPDAYTGKFFPQSLKQLYRDRTLGQ